MEEEVLQTVSETVTETEVLTNTELLTSINNKLEMIIFILLFMVCIHYAEKWLKLLLKGNDYYY